MELARSSQIGSGRRHAAGGLRRPRIALAIAAVSCLLVAAARADTVVLRNGTHLAGEVLRVSGDEVVLKLQKGVVTFKRSQVVEVRMGNGDRSRAPSGATSDRRAPVPPPPSTRAPSRPPAEEPRPSRGSAPARRVPRFHTEDLVDLTGRAERGEERAAEAAAAGEETARPSHPLVEELEALVASRSPRAYQSLVTRLLDRDAEVFRAAAFGLAVLDDPRGITVMENLLSSELLSAATTPERLATLVRALTGAGSRGSVPTVGRAATSARQPGVRAVATRALGELGFPEALPFVESAARDEDPRVRAAAAEALPGVSRTAEVVPLLESLLEDTDATTRLRATASLASLRIEESETGLFRALERNESFELAARELVKRGSTRAIDALRDVARADRPDPVRHAAVRAIGAIGGDVAKEALIELARDPSDLEKVASDALRALLPVADEGPADGPRTEFRAGGRRRSPDDVDRRSPRP